MLRLSILLLVCLPVISVAKGLSPYLPLNMSPEVEAQIEKVVALTPGAPLTRPYKAAEINRRLKLLKDSHPQLVTQLSKYLERYTKPYGLTHAGVSLSASSGAEKTIVNRRNLSSETTASASIGAYGYLSPYAYVSAGFEVRDEGGITHTNTHLAFGHEYAQVEVGYREHWFSPFKDSAMLVSTHAKVSPSITISNSMPITDWNIRYEVFYSQLEPVDAIVLGDETFPGRPRHAGLHLSFTPLDFWTVGINRTLQFGGGEREVSFSDFVEALLDPAGKDNVGDVDTDDPNFEFGNQQASITSRMNFNLFTPVSLYAEYAGEDTNGESNFRLGNDSVSFGVFLPTVFDNFSFRYEYSNWSEKWYTHHLYPDGYRNDGQVMGHWAGGERTGNQDPQGASHALNIIWAMQNDSMLDVSFRSSKHDSFRTTNYETSVEFEATYSFTNRHGFWGATILTGKDVFGEDYAHLTGFYRW